MNSLANEQCAACHPDSPHVTETEMRELLAEIPEWHVVTREDIPRLERTYKFKNFAEALAFTNRVGALAEQQDHHPALLTEFGKVTVTWWTHAIKGLHRNDFVMAAKSDELYASAQGQFFV
jgi:4a-hydroxytetrahydrobiopterin dehydratase